MERPSTLSPAARIDRLLASQPVIWLSTVRPDGRPHLVPIWFSWDGEQILVASKPQAQKVRNLRANPTVMLALGEAEDDFDVGMVEGRAELLDAPAANVLPPAHLAKYRRRMAAIGVEADEFLATYSQVIRITPTRYLPWHGRTVPASAVPAALAGGGLRHGVAGRLAGARRSVAGRLSGARRAGGRLANRDGLGSGVRVGRSAAGAPVAG